MKKLRVALVGCGNINADLHAPAFKKFDDVEVVALCDKHRATFDRLKKVLGLSDDVPTFTDYKELLEMPGIDAIDICTRNFLHAPIAIAALNKGIHVLCEKPDALNADEAIAMKEAADKNGKTLMVIRNNRFMPISVYLKDIIEKGYMGHIYSARCGWMRRRGAPPKGTWFSDMAQSGGGPLIDLGVHMIDLTMWLMGNPKPVAVIGAVYNELCQVKEGETHKFDVEDMATGYIRFDNGASLQLEFSWASNIKEERRYFELRGNRAGAYWRSTEADHPEIYSEIHGRITDLFPVVDNLKAVDHHEANLRHFVDVVMYGEKPLVTPEQGVDMMKILDAIYKSAEIGKEVFL